MIPNFTRENPEEYVFPDRKDLKKKKEEDKNFYEDVVEQVKSIDVDGIDFENSDFKPRSEIKQKQMVYFWIRVYLKEELDIEPNTDVKITYQETGESITTKFICYSKKGLDKDNDNEVVNYIDEDDKRVLCLMIEEERININNSDIPFLKTLFKIGRYYVKQIFLKNDLILTTGDETVINWFDIDF